MRQLATLAWMWLRPLILLTGVAAGLHFQSGVYHLDISVGAQVPKDAAAVVFYSYGGQVFPDQHNQVMLTYKGAEGSITYEARLRTWRPIREVRLDLANKPGDISWSSLRLSGPGGSRYVHGKDLPSIVQSYDQLQIVSTSDTGQQMVAPTNDPKILVAVPRELADLPPSLWWRHWLSILGGSLAVVAFVEFLLRALKTSHPLNIRATAVLTRVSESWSENATIRFSPASLVVYLVLVAIGFAWVAFKLNQSSVGIWDEFFPAEFVDRDFVLGSPKSIRSDEWHTMTPWMLSQVQSGMKSDNSNLGAPSAAMLAGAPQMGPLMIAQPKYWGFVFLDLERGFSWLWAAKTIGLIAGFFTLLMLLTKGDVVISLAGALGIWGSSYVQWWLSSVPAEAIAGFSAAVVGSVYLLQARKIGGMVFGAILVALAVPNLLLHLYPPYLQPLAYLSIFMLVGLLANRQSWLLFKERQTLRLQLAGMVVAVLAVLIGFWYLEVGDAIRLVLNTDYPGHRVSSGGDYDLSRLFYGVFESWNVDNLVIPFPPGNPSEASSFWMLFPLALILVDPREWIRPAMRPVLWMMAFCVMALAWISLPIPAFMRSALAAGGWYMTPSSRGDFGLAVGSAVLMATLIAGIARGEVRAIRVPSVVIWLLTFGAMVAYGLYLQTMDPLFFVLPRVLLASFVIASAAWAIHKRKRILYFWVIVLSSLPSMVVNPVQAGLGDYLQKGIFQKARSVGGGASNVWVVYGSSKIAQGFKAVGLNVVNGTHYAPRMEWIDLLDPDHKYQHEWNRYAHIDWEYGDPGQHAVFKIAYADSYVIKLDVCDPVVRRLGVDRVAFSYAPRPSETRCLVPLATGDHSGVSFYKFAAP